MDRIFNLIVILLVGCLSYGQNNPNHNYVKGYLRKDGTYVKGHYRTLPNYTNRDNFSTRGNINPYTGKSGWVKPDNEVTGGYSLHKRPETPSTKPIKDGKSLVYFESGIDPLGRMVVTYQEGQDIFRLCEDCKDVSVNKDLNYYSYDPKFGIRHFKGEYQGILLDGEYKSFNGQGQLKYKAEFKKGLKHGKHVFWDENGKVEDEYHYTDGRIEYAKFTNDHGYVVEWIGRPFYEGSIKNIYNSAGVLVEKSNAVEDFVFRHRVYNEFTGRLELDITKGMEGVFDGPYITYHGNGNKEFEGFYNKNFQDSVWNWYDESGNVELTRRYRVLEIKRANGKLKEKGSEYFNTSIGEWIREGEWLFYTRNGEVIRDRKSYWEGTEVESMNERSIEKH